jgi:hypothetical protein
LRSKRAGKEAKPFLEKLKILPAKPAESRAVELKSIIVSINYDLPTLASGLL